MNYKEKYEQALARAREIHRNEDEKRKDMEFLFPELKESEDERIRKAIIEFFESEDNNTTYSLVPKKDILAWLKKQGEQPGEQPKEFTYVHEVEVGNGNIKALVTNKVQLPKFKIGDWVVFNDKHESVYQVEKIENYQYILRHILGGSMPLSFNHEDMIRLWTIEDAKDGDVLAIDNNSHIILVKESHNSTWGRRLSCWCHLLDGEFEVVEYHTKVEGLHPATKEQRDYLFKKMKEAGYEWDAENKKPKRIEQNTKDAIDMEDNICYSVQNPCFLSDRFVYAHHKELGTVYIKLNCFEKIEEIGVNIVKRMHNKPLDKIKELCGHRKANEIEQSLIDHIGEEYWQHIHKMNLL